MSDTQHTKDVNDGVDHLKVSTSAGGKCLNRHVGGTPPPKDNSCSHRWQAWLKMSDDSLLYDWPKYRTLAERKSRISVWSRWGFGSIKQPIKGAWNVNFAKNFREKCYRPYWHEAHHIVPNSTLRSAINEFGKSTGKGPQFSITIRIGLANEKYNLNEKNNMIMLPMGKSVAKALGLPRHRVSPAYWSHRMYSSKVKAELSKALSALKQDLVDHQKPKYKPLKKEIVKLSERLYRSITSTARATLDDMTDAEISAPSTGVSSF